MVVQTEGLRGFGGIAIGGIVYSIIKRRKDDCALYDGSTSAIHFPRMLLWLSV